MCLFFYMELGAGKNDFDEGKSITQAIGRGEPSKWMLPTSKSFFPTPCKQQVH
jgi:hypothetical protein